MKGCSGVCCGHWQEAFLFQYYQKQTDTNADWPDFERREID